MNRTGNHGSASFIFGESSKSVPFLFVKAGCDYTGWDCQASNSLIVARSMQDMVKFGMDESDRAALGIDFNAVDFGKRVDE